MNIQIKFTYTLFLLDERLQTNAFVWKNTDLIDLLEKDLKILWQVFIMT